MDERPVVVFFTLKTFSFLLRLGKKSSVFTIIFLWEKITKKFNVTIYFDMGVTLYQKTVKLP